MKPLLLIDMNYLCHRAYYALGELTFGGAGTGMIFGVLRDIVSLQDSFATGQCVFAFDSSGEGLRHAILPTYKASRRVRYAEESDEDKSAREDFHRQVRYLRTRYLPAAGFRNVFAAQGFEADDIIASIAAHVPCNKEVIIIASDQDLWQCLRPNVWMWNPHNRRGYDIEAFRKQWGIEPERWPDVKALAGCSTDDVPGVSGVGEITAAKWLRGMLGAHTETARKLAAATELYRTNIKLVRLPFTGTPVFDLKPDEVTEERWHALADELGMRSIRGTVPRTASRRSKGRKRTVPV
jgi:DNA polymerase-1